MKEWHEFNDMRVYHYSIKFNAMDDFSIVSWRSKEAGDL
ncbi:hypothetical protein BBC0178_007960 [Bartonella apihabitans]|uniref:Uncharacterized protein n=1 Tax=Bartonella apihabitans TaxID=2750929 RepID=A0A1U9MAG0_9HYPH|nr:hypothetical protein BBC0178_007960 [Bartonella apihabitans]